MYNKIIIFFILILSVNKTYAQASWEPFGQNRVQYRTFEWNYFDSTNFRTFYYDQGKPNAQYALKMAEQELSHIVYLMGGRLNKKLNIIIYNSFSDYRQTNLGRKNENINDANGGKVEVIGDNIPVYFNGDHNNLKKQILKGVASAIKDNMLFGDNLKEIVKNAVKLDLSDWYTLGYVSYIADDWTPEMRTSVVNIINKKPKANLSEYAIENPVLIGNSFWRFIAINYGESQISNLLYLTRYRKSINNSIQIVFKKPAKDFFNDWKNYYALDTTIYNSSKDTIREVLARIPIKNGSTYSSISVSPTGKEVAFVEKKDGEYFIKVLDTKFNKIHTIIEGGIKAMQDLADPDYPLITWSPSGKKVAVLYVKRNQLNIRIFTNGQNKMENRVIKRSKIDRITGMCFMSDDYSLAITGIKKGASDLFEMTIKNNRVENITKDLFDDKNPVIIQNGTFSGIIFMSNRTSSYIGEDAKSDAFNDQFNLFLYQPSKGNNLIPLSNIKSEIKYPIQWGLEDISYLIEENGKLVRKVVKLEKRKELHDTFNQTTSAPLAPNTIKQEYIYNSQKIIEISLMPKEYIIYSSNYKDRIKEDSIFNSTLEIDTLSNVKNITHESINSEYITTFEQDSSSEFLENIFLDKNNISKRYQVYTEAVNKIKTFKYKSTFYPDFVQTSLDNTLLFTRYQIFEMNNTSYQNPPLAGFLTSTLTDVMEDYKLTGAARLGTDFKSLDYFLRFNNFRKRTDWEILYFHHRYKFTEEGRLGVSPYPIVNRTSLDYLQAKFTYPFDILQSIHFQTGIRYDKTEALAMEKYSIEIPVEKQFWSVSRFEYIYDNSISPILNIHKGSRVKLFAEYQYKLNNGTKGFYNFGYDARNYLTLYKNIIFASRIAGAHSGGNAKILYKIGGVDNDLNPQQDQNAVIDLSQNYAFQSLATNLRGYRQGFRNGNSFLVINEEIRFPIYNTFFKKPTKSGFLRNLQLIAFADIGSSWKGVFPNADNIQSPNVVKDKNSNVTVYINNSKYDFGLGYGTGIRTKILGYFLRTDFAWNIEGAKKPIVHISLATDF